MLTAECKHGHSFDARGRCDCGMTEAEYHLSDRKPPCVQTVPDNHRSRQNYSCVNVVFHSESWVKHDIAVLENGGMPCLT